jgi:hypothetical protein
VKIPEKGLMGRYWSMSDRASLWFFVIAFFVAWLIGGTILVLVTSELAAFFLVIFVGIVWNLAISFYNILHI